MCAAGRRRGAGDSGCRMAGSRVHVRARPPRRRRRWSHRSRPAVGAGLRQRGGPAAPLPALPAHHRHRLRTVSVSPAARSSRRHGLAASTAPPAETGPPRHVLSGLATGAKCLLYVPTHPWPMRIMGFSQEFSASRFRPKRGNRVDRRLGHCQSILSSSQLLMAYLIINAVNRQKFNVHLSTVLQLLALFPYTVYRAFIRPRWGTSVPRPLLHTLLTKLGYATRYTMH